MLLIGCETLDNSLRLKSRTKTCKKKNRNKVEDNNTIKMLFFCFVLQTLLYKGNRGYNIVQHRVDISGQNTIFNIALMKG